MANLLRLPTFDRDGALHVVVESPRGSRVKLQYDPELEAFTLSRPLILGLRYPFDWGFVSSTVGPDGDPIDAMVLSEAPTFPGVVLACRTLGALAVTQNGPDGRVRNDRLLMVPVKAPRTDGIVDARQLHERVRKELEQFFIAAVALADKDVQIEGWEGPDEAMALIQRGSAMVKREG
jgi:inorganic pyrophosphatase